jgi:hypothetical protein
MRQQALFRQREAGIRQRLALLPGSRSARYFERFARCLFLSITVHPERSGARCYGACRPSNADTRCCCPRCFFIQAATLAVVVTVVLLNRLLWQPPYRLAEMRYRME